MFFNKKEKPYIIPASYFHNKENTMETKKQYTDAELEEYMHYWLDHYTATGDSHYPDTSPERIVEIYWDRAVGRVIDDLEEMTEEEADIICERLENLF